MSMGRDGYYKTCPFRLRGGSDTCLDGFRLSSLQLLPLNESNKLIGEGRKGISKRNHIDDG